MAKFPEEDVKEGQDFCEFYIDMIENHRDHFLYYLSDDIRLDWFGRTIKGVKNIRMFLSTDVANVRHSLPNAELCSTIGYKESHVIKYTPREIIDYTTLPVHADKEETPPNLTASPGGSKKREIGQGDGVHNCNDESPIKRTRLDGDVIEAEPAAPLKILNITSDGSIEFRRKSTKKYQRENKWSRPCKFQAAFSRTPSGYLIHLIIYQGNVKCKRNLMNDFNSVEGGND